MHYLVQYGVASKCYLLITPIILLLLSPPFEPLPSTGLRRSTGARRETPPLKRDGGGICHAVVRSPAVTVARHARAHSLPLGPRTGPGHRRCRHPLLPARAEPHPPRLVLVPPSLDLRPPHPRQESRKPPRRPPLPLPPHGDSNTNDQRSVEATRDQSPEDVRPRATQSASSSSPPSRAGGGRGAEHSALSLPGSCSRSVVPPHGHPSLSSSSSRARRGGAPAAAVAGRGGSDGGGSGGSDYNNMFCCGMWSYVV